MKERAIELLRRLSQAHGAPASEGAVRRIMREVVGDGCHTDRMGNLMAEKAGLSSSPRLLLAAHLDETGFAVQSVTANGWLKLVPLGGWWPHTLLAQRVRILNRAGQEILGVIGSKPPHMLTEGEREKVRKIEDLYIDIGAQDADEVGKRFGVGVGDPVVPEAPFTRLANPDWLMGKAFDDRAGVALMLQLYESLGETQHPNTLCLAGTVQEELGMRGAQTVCASVEPEVAIVLEGTPADDLPGIPGEERQGIPGKGVQIRLMDPAAVMNRGLAQFAIDTARACGIPYQVAVRRSGGTDAKAIHLHEQGVPTVVLGIPSRYIHTHNSMIHLNDYVSALTLLRELVVRLDQNTVASFTAYVD